MHISEKSSNFAPKSHNSHFNTYHMEYKIKTVGVLTSGGDSPGMNAAVRAVTRAAIANNIRVKAIYRGYKGLMDGEVQEFTTQDEAMDLNHSTMYDEGEAVRNILPLMKHCRYLDMDSCGVSSESMAEIRDAYPDMDVVWRIWFAADLFTVIRICGTSIQKN